MDALVLIPVGALVLAASLRFEVGAGRGLYCWVAVAGVFAVFLGIRALVPDESVFFASEVSRRVRAQVEEFRKSGARDFYIVEGSSVAAHGCDPEVLRQEIVARGLDVGVLQFSAQGANHFERAFLMEAFWRGLNDEEKARLQNGRVVLAGEVFDAYDKEPLYLFTKESLTERAKVYMSPSYAWAAWQAYWVSLPGNLSGMEKMAISSKYLSKIMERHLLNRFGAGALADMNSRARKKKTRAFFALEGSKQNFDYEGAEKSRRDFAPAQISGDAISPGWKACENFKSQKTSLWVDEEVFFAMPVLENNRLAYQINFKSNSNKIVLGPATSIEMEAFYGKGNWFDGVHPTKKGAVLFSRWLAERFLEIQNK
jgi:hypothetical protein